MVESYMVLAMILFDFAVNRGCVFFGRLRRGFLVEELGEVGVDVLRAVKAALDPAGRLNPGVLIP